MGENLMHMVSNILQSCQQLLQLLAADMLHTWPQKGILVAA